RGAKATKAGQAQSPLKMRTKREPITALVSEEVRPIRIPAPDKLLSPPIIATDDVEVGYEPGRPVLSGLSLRIDNDDRIALLGANGNGKSTLVKLLAARLQPEHGTITRASGLRVAYFAQHQLDELEPAASPYDHVRRLMPDAPEAKVRARVGAIGFSGAAGNTKVEKLSGGEKARLLLGLATFSAPHLVILDEPTNHLDIDSRAALIEAINDFPGAVILVSHDRYLLEACADRLWLGQSGTVKPFDGDLDDYRRRVLSESGADPQLAAKPAPRPDPSAARPAASDPRQPRHPGPAPPRRGRKARGNGTLAQTCHQGRNRTRTSDATTAQARRNARRRRFIRARPGTRGGISEDARQSRRCDRQGRGRVAGGEGGSADGVIGEQSKSS